MKRLLCFVVSAVSLCAQSPKGQAPVALETKPDDLCSIEGQVTNIATGAPLRKAEIMLRGSGRSAGGGMPPSFSATSDAGGNFAIKDIEPGRYMLTAQRTGFVSLYYGSRGQGRAPTDLTLSAGQRTKDLSLRMTPQAVITGRIADENNEPVASAYVVLLRYSYRMGKHQLQQSGSATTNDLGEYRIYRQPPGRYYLYAKEEEHSWEASVDASAVPATDSYVTTYYPGAIDVKAAVPIEVGAGVELRGVNLTLAKARTFRVRGHVEGPHNGALTFSPRGQSRLMGIGQWDYAIDQKGNFEIDGALPGAYTIMATFGSDTNRLMARQDVDVGESNVDGIVLTPAPGFEVSGELTVEGGNAPNLDSINIDLRSETGVFFGTSSSRVHDGAFSISDVPPDLYHLQINGLPEGYWVKSIRMGDHEAKQAGLDLSRGPGAPIVVTIAPNAGQIDGTVTNEHQQPAAGATMVLVPEPKLREYQDAYKYTTTDQNGRFSLKNIDPGEYKLFAWEDVEYGAYMDPDFLRPLEDRGQPISIQEGSRESVQLDVIPADSANAARRGN